MRLITFELDGKRRIGLVTSDNRVLDFKAVEAGSAREFPNDMIGFIREAEWTVDAVRRLAEKAPSANLPMLGSVHLLAPIPRPLKNVFCVGRNYAAHAAEGARAQGREVHLPEVPEFFTKPPTAVTGPDSSVPIDPAVTQKFDYEVELGVVIGKAGKNIKRSRAMEHVFGFTICNDFTARDLQRRHGQWFKGKGLDFSCAMGPWIVEKSALPGFADLAIRLRVNGETRQDSCTSNMIFDVPTLIESLSAGLTLEPGDVISTGTPEGVGYAMDPPRFLHPGDRVEAEIEGIGFLRNVMVAAPADE
jgi:2-keto-4-pentenoate hydratase/2-oxohepta-3-ene-1,7-dioic acid hydratase in catechol pathway